MKIENVNIYDLNESIKASKYPMTININECNSDITETVLKLAHASGGHDNFLKGITVSFDLTFSNKAWIEIKRYKFINIISSQSTMHRITKLDIRKQCNEYVWESIILNLEIKIREYNSLENKNSEHAKHLYLEILYNTPSGYELTARISTNYMCLKNVYNQRKNHRLPEWISFCEWIKTLPNGELIVSDTNV